MDFWTFRLEIGPQMPPKSFPLLNKLKVSQLNTSRNGSLLLKEERGDLLTFPAPEPDIHFTLNADKDRCGGHSCTGCC